MLTLSDFWFFTGLKHKSIYNATRNIIRVRSFHVEHAAEFIHQIARWNSMRFLTVIFDRTNVTSAWKHSNVAKIWSSIPINTQERNHINVHIARKPVSKTLSSPESAHHVIKWMLNQNPFCYSCKFRKLFLAPKTRSLRQVRRAGAANDRHKQTS